LLIHFQDYWSKSNENERSTVIHSTFFQHIKTCSWLPTIERCHKIDEQTCEIRSIHMQTFHRSNDIYLRTASIERLLADHVPYLDIDVAIDPLFANQLGLTYDRLSHVDIDCFVRRLGVIEQITHVELLVQLMHWSQSTFSTTVIHMENVYEYICQQMNIDDVRTLIDEHPFIFIPIERAERHVIVNGKFIARSCLCWQDSSNLLSKYAASMNVSMPVTLDMFYAEHKHLFVHTLAIRLQPTIDEYILVLSRNSMMSDR
jgi:hypothetical protein